MRALVLSVALVAVCGACSLFRTPVEVPTLPDSEAMKAHQHACQAKGELKIFQDKILGESCEETAMDLELLVSTDDDCKAFYGDAGVSVGLCHAIDGGAK